MPRPLCKDWYLFKNSPAIMCGLGAGLWDLPAPSSCLLCRDTLSPGDLGSVLQTLGFWSPQQSWNAGSLQVRKRVTAQQHLSCPSPTSSHLSFLALRGHALLLSCPCSRKHVPIHVPQSPCPGPFPPGARNDIEATSWQGPFRPGSTLRPRALASGTQTLC